MIVTKGIVEIEGKKLEIGGTIKANENSYYEGLIGFIEEIRTDKDKETENETDDIIVSFQMPENQELIAKLEKQFTALYGLEKKMNELCIDYVVCSYDEIDMIPF